MALRCGRVVEIWIQSAATTITTSSARGFACGGSSATNGLCHPPPGARPRARPGAAGPPAASSERRYIATIRTWSSSERGPPRPRRVQRMPAAPVHREHQLPDLPDRQPRGSRHRFVVPSRHHTQGQTSAATPSGLRDNLWAVGTFPSVRAVSAPFSPGRMVRGRRLRRACRVHRRPAGCLIAVVRGEPEDAA